MVYLIDDKKSRQEVLGWKISDFKKYVNVLKTIYTYKQIKEENLSSEIFSNNSIILFHESFFDSIENQDKIESQDVREKLTNWASQHNLVLVKFSGAINSRALDKNQVSLPVNILYRNLEIFLTSLNNEDKMEISLKKLLFGENYKIEEILLLKKEIWETKFKFSPLLNNKVKEINILTNKNIDIKISQNPIILKSLLNE